MRFDTLSFIKSLRTLYQSKYYVEKLRHTKFCDDPLKIASSAPEKVMSWKCLTSILIISVIYKDSPMDREY